MRRDQFVKGMGAAAGAAFIDPFVFLSQQTQDQINHTKVSNQQIERLTGAAYGHARGYYHLTEERRLRSLLSDWASTQRLLMLPATHSQRRDLLDVYARLSGILGLLAFDRVEDSRARALFGSGLDAAREAGDTEVLGWLYGRYSDVVNRNDTPQDVIQVASRGLKVLGSSRTTAAARLHGWVARGYAKLGDVQATRTHLDTADRILGNAANGCWPNGPAAPQAFTYGESGLLRTTSVTAMWLGDNRAALECCDQAAAIYNHTGRSARTVTAVAVNIMRRANAMLRLGEVEGATELATTTLRAYRGVAVPLMLRRAWLFSQELAAAAPGSRYAVEFGEFISSRS